MHFRNIVDLVFALVLTACTSQPSAQDPASACHGLQLKDFDSWPAECKERRVAIAQETTAQEATVIQEQELVRPEGCDCADRTTMACGEYCCRSRLVEAEQQRARRRQARAESGWPSRIGGLISLPEGEFLMKGRSPDDPREICLAPSVFVFSMTGGNYYKCAADRPPGCPSLTDACAIVNREACILWPSVSTE